MEKAERTVDLQINGGLNCAQAILTVYGEPVGINPEQAKLLGRPWGGGTGGLGKTCGYITGAILAIAHGKNDSDEDCARKDTKMAVQELLRRFEVRFGSLKCKELLGADMSTEEGARKIKAEKLVARHCPEIGRTVAKILEELL